MEDLQPSQNLLCSICETVDFSTLFLSNQARAFPNRSLFHVRDSQSCPFCRLTLKSLLLKDYAELSDATFTIIRCLVEPFGHMSPIPPEKSDHRGGPFLIHINQIFFQIDHAASSSVPY